MGISQGDNRVCENSIRQEHYDILSDENELVFTIFAKSTIRWRDEIEWPVVALFLLILTAYFFGIKVRKSTASSLQSLLDSIPPILDESFNDGINSETLPEELVEISNRIKSFVQENKNLNKKIVDQEKAQLLYNLSCQVAHDIRSPLAALDMVLSNLPQVPEERRLIVRSSLGRIRDILNNLVGKKPGPNGKSIEGEKDGRLSVQLLSSLIDSLIAEKRTQYRSKLGIDIKYVFNSENYGLFSYIEPISFSRMLSGLVDNAVEASNFSGRIKLNVVPLGGKIQIVLEDFGKGIPKKLIPLIGIRGNAFNKEGGSGLGLHYAIKVAEDFGGSLTVNSIESVGTKIIVELPRCETPLWFTNKIILSKNICIVILDDDPSIHHIWKGRIDSIKPNGEFVHVENFSTPNNFKEWCRLNRLEYDQIIYLIDYEFLGFEETGLDLIEELHIFNQSILVTSRFEDEAIRSTCSRFNVSMIPKGLAGFVPIIFS